MRRAPCRVCREKSVRVQERRRNIVKELLCGPSRQMDGQLVSPEAQVGDGFGSSLSASSDCSPGILAVGGPLF